MSGNSCPTRARPTTSGCLRPGSAEGAAGGRDAHPPVARFLGDLRLRERAPGEAAPPSLMESGAEEALPVASLSRSTLS